VTPVEHYHEAEKHLKALDDIGKVVQKAQDEGAWLRAEMAAEYHQLNTLIVSLAQVHATLATVRVPS
jgi:hypothetical protein